MGRRSLRNVIVLFSMLIAVTGRVGAAGSDELPDSWQVDPSFFGMHFHYAVGPKVPGGPKTVIPDGSRIKGWRMHDMRVRWAELQPARDRWNFAPLDAAVALAGQKGMEPLLELGSTPAWASARPQEKCPYGMGCSAEPTNIADWENYVRTVAMRYRGKIRLYEVWNEPKFSDVPQSRNMSFFSGSTDAMLKLAETAHRILKEVDPANQLASPGFTVHVSQLEHYLAAGGGRYADAVSFHFYSNTPEEMVGRAQAARRAMKRAGLADLQLWNTEQYYELLPNGVSAPGPNGFGVDSIETLSAYVQRAHILAAAYGINRMYWYGYELSMIAQDGSPTAVAVAYDTVARWLGGGRIGPCRNIDARTTACPISRGGEQFWTVWRPRGGAVSFQVPGEWRVTAYETPAGVTRQLEGESVDIGPAPILLKRDNAASAPDAKP